MGSDGNLKGVELALSPQLWERCLRVHVGPPALDAATWSPRASASQTVLVLSTSLVPWDFYVNQPSSFSRLCFQIY